MDIQSGYIFRGEIVEIGVGMIGRFLSNLRVH